MILTTPSSLGLLDLFDLLFIQNLEAWEEVKKEVANIEEHPNKPPPKDEPEASTSASNATVGPSTHAR